MFTENCKGNLHSEKINGSPKILSVSIAAEACASKARLKAFLKT
jgi:hypothetical protein